jgi:hypothetical protein
MKKLLIIKALCFVAWAAIAQQPAAKKPPLSPEAAFTQQFGESEILVQYARPSARGRKVFGGIVPFDSLWRTGAGESTTLVFKEDVVISDKKIAAGKYALFTIPRADEWTIVLNSDTGLHGIFGYDQKKDLHRFTVKSAKTERFYETFTIEINDFDQHGGASLNLIWENTLVKIPLQNPLYMVADAATKPTETLKTDAHAGHDMSKMTANTEGGKTADLKAQFAPVIAAYYGVKDALVADNDKGAAEKGKAMKAALIALDTKTWTAKDRIAYDEVAKKLETDAEHIGDNAGKIDHQREHFITLSKNLLAVAKTLKINSETTYLQFCPMANDNKGAYWLSKEQPIKNPYFGKKMLNCGSVKETLK